MYTPPELKCDARRTLTALQRTERAVVWNLLKHLEQHGWRITHIDNLDGYEPVENDVGLMEEVFALDECNLRAAKGTDHHHIYIVLGNDGYDAVCDWAYYESDRDGFNALMEAFSGEDYVQP